MKKKIIYVFMLSMLFISNVNAHPGRIDSNGCHICKTNCSKWGLENNEYHCHNGVTYKNKKGQTFNSDGTEIIESNNDNSVEENNASNNEDNNSINNSSNNSSTSNSNTNKSEDILKEDEKKSSDNTLKAIIIDGQTYNNFDNIVHITYNKVVNIEVVPNNDKAVYEIKNIEELVDGDNYINIVVTAETGAIKTYNIVINKKRILSSEKDIEVIINDEKVAFQNYEAEINVDSSVKRLEIDYILKDNKATVEMNEVGELKSGENVIIIKVNAEDGSEQEYKIIVYKYSKVEDIIYTAIGLGIIYGTGYGIYKIIKKRKIFKKIGK